jgi:hypothetical protein
MISTFQILTNYKTNILITPILAQINILIIPILTNHQINKIIEKTQYLLNLKDFMKMTSIAKDNNLFKTNNHSNNLE